MKSRNIFGISAPWSPVSVNCMFWQEEWSGVSQLRKQNSEHSAVTGVHTWGPGGPRVGGSFDRKCLGMNVKTLLIYTTDLILTSGCVLTEKYAYKSSLNI